MRKFSVILFVMFLSMISVSVYGATDFGTALNIMSVNQPPDALSASRGNTWVADPEGSSNNPACIAAGESFGAAGTASYGATFFKNGPTVHSYETSAYVSMPFGGVVQLTLGNSQSGYAQTRMGGKSVRFDYEPFIDIAYGIKVKENFLCDGDKLFIGVGGGTNWFKMGFASRGNTNSISRSRGINLYTGLLYQPTENINLGATYSWFRDWNEDRDVLLGTSSRFPTVIHQVRAGASWTVLPKFGTSLSADLQYLGIGSVNRIQAFAGVEQQVVKDRLYVYAGWAHSGPTAGLGLYFKRGGVNVAYMNNPHSELNAHLGRAQMLMATAFFKW